MSEAINVDESIIVSIKNDYKMLVKLPEVVIENDTLMSEDVEVSENQVYVWSTALEMLLNEMQSQVSESELYSYRN